MIFSTPIRERSKMGNGSAVVIIGKQSNIGFKSVTVISSCSHLPSAGLAGGHAIDIAADGVAIGGGTVACCKSETIPSIGH